MKKLVSVVLVMLISQVAFAQDDQISISAKCLNKITQFSTQFANASMPNFGSIPVSIGEVEVSSKATALGESGFADGTGTYEVTIGETGETETSKVEFSFRYMTEPHCTIVKIQLADAM